MRTLPVDQQKKAILYATKDMLWGILEEDDAWLNIFKVLPDDYYNQFLARLRSLGTKDDQAIKNLAKVYVQNKVRLDHLQEAIAKTWQPEDLEDATSWLSEQGFLNRPLSPVIKAGAVDDARKAIGAIQEALALPRREKSKLVTAARGERPKVGKAPKGASKDGKKCWNSILKNSKKRKIITAPRGLEDQWALAMKFWFMECSKSGKQPYESTVGPNSLSMHASNVLIRSVRELSNGLCADGYSMARPASRKLKALFDQLVKDGYDMGNWSPIRPKPHGEI